MALLQVGVTVFVLHIGPSADEVGGMASVIRMHLAASGHHGVWQRAVAEYTNRGLLHTAIVYLLAVGRVLASLPRTTLLHLHLSQGGSFVRALAFVLLARLTATPVLCTLHGSRFGIFAKTRPRLVVAVVRRCATVLVLSHENARVVRALAPGAHIEIVSNAVKVPDRAPPPVERPIVVFAGELSERKGIDVLVSAWSVVSETITDARLVLIGRPVDVKVPAVEGIIHLGEQPAARVHEELRHARLACLPSRSEAMPMFILEAMAHARPVISTDIHDIARVIGNGGCVVPPGDCEALAAALIHGLENDAWSAYTGGQAYLRAKQLFSLEAFAARFAELYRGVANPQ